MRELVYTIYALVDPRNNSIRYVGITDNMKMRYMHHLREAGACTAKGIWLAELQQERLQPEVKILEMMKLSKNQRSIAEDREIYWIKKLEASGISLVNIRDTIHDPKKHKVESSQRALALFQEDTQQQGYMLEKLRKQAGLQVDQLARLAQVSDHSYRKMVRGEAVGEILADRVLHILSERLKREITINDIGINIL
jgi:predicted GIY-YIG superfamily endonuclease